MHSADYDIPLLPADRPDDDSRTVALGHGATTGQPARTSAADPSGAARGRGGGDRAGAPDGSGAATGIPLPPDRPPTAPQEDGTRGNGPAASPDPAAARDTTAQRSGGATEPTPGSGRPAAYADGTAQPRTVRYRARSQAVAAAACMVLGLGLIGGAVTGSWLTGDSSAAAGSGQSFAAAAGLWHNTPVDRLFPPVVHGSGAGPGGADRTWTRISVAPDSGCTDAFDPLLHKVLAPAGCLRLLRATYTDATRSYVTTVGLLFTKTDVAGMRALRSRFTDDGLDRRTDLIPRAYPAEHTVAAGFGDAQRASWTVSVLTDAPVVVYAVSGFADGRTVSDPQPATEAVKPSASTAPAQAGLGHEAKGLADRVARGLRKAAAGGAGTDTTDDTAAATDTEQAR